MSTRTEALAQRVAEGHRHVIAFIEGCSDVDWHTYCPNEERTVGVVLHHVASALPAELDMARVLAAGQPLTVTPEVVDRANAQHAEEHAACTREETLLLLRRNSALVVSGIQALSDEELDRAAPVSLHWDAPLTTQYFIEEHPLSHSYWHMANVHAALAT